MKLIDHFKNFKKKEILKKVDSEGIILVYEPSSNTFGAYTSDGTTRTFFKPDPKIHGYNNNLDYWNSLGIENRGYVEKENNPLCPVCGFDIFKEFRFLPWNQQTPSYEICPSCGIQFGYEDAAGGDIEKREKIYQQWRENWIKNGMKWRGGNDDKNKPKNWDPQQQLNILLELEK